MDIFINDFNGIGLVDMITNDNEYLDFSILSKVQNIFFTSLALEVCMHITNAEPIYKNGNIFLDDVFLSIVCIVNTSIYIFTMQRFINTFLGSLRFDSLQAF